MKNKHHVILGLSALGLIAAGALLSWHLKGPSMVQVGAGGLPDKALLALIKNDDKSFGEFLEEKGDMHALLPLIDGKRYTVAEGLSYFERPNFVKALQAKGLNFIRQSGDGEHDILSLSIRKNNPELLELYMKESPDMRLTYGDEEWSLLHMASALCGHKLVPILHVKGKLGWDLRAKDGSTPLTLAAEHECLPVLGYWKDQGADFRARDARGNTALSILKKKKDAALVAFAESFETRLPAALPAPKQEVSFYKKRKIPRDQMVDHAALIEPEERPVEAVETAEMSEFAD